MPYERARATETKAHKAHVSIPTSHTFLCLGIPLHRMPSMSMSSLSAEHPRRMAMLCRAWVHEPEPGQVLKFVSSCPEVSMFCHCSAGTCHSCQTHGNQLPLFASEVQHPVPDTIVGVPLSSRNSRTSFAVSFTPCKHNSKQRMLLRARTMATLRHRRHPVRVTRETLR